LNFDIQNLWVLQIGGVEIWITETMRNTWIIMAVLIGFAIAVRIMLPKFKDIPKGFQNTVEAMVEMFMNFVKSSAGEKLMPLGSWYFMAFSFLLLANLSGLIPGMRPPTADWTMTFAFAMVTFVLIQYMGYKHRRGKYLRSIFLDPNPAFGILNVIGELARPISLSFRLFGNILGGMILMNILYSMLPVVARFVFPAALHFYFDIFSGVLQAYIFCVLSISFIGVSAEEA